MIHVGTQYYIGDVEAMYMGQPIWDLIIGNIQDARSPQDPDPEWKDYCMATEASERVQTDETEELGAPETEVLDVTDVTSYEVSQAVVTRTQTVKAAKPTKTLSVLHCIDTSLTTTDCLAEQQPDDSLTTCWKRARENQPPRCTTTAASHYTIRKDLLYRVYGTMDPHSVS